MSVATIASLGIGSIVDSIFKGIDSLFTSDEEREAARLKVLQELQKPHIMQAMTNLKEAEHASWFVAGWRPAIGWVCALGLGYQFLVAPFAVHIAYLTGLPYELPTLDSSMLMTMTINLLGLGGLRTYEKVTGVAREVSPKRGSIDSSPLPPIKGGGIY